MPGLRVRGWMVGVVAMGIFAAACSDGSEAEVEPVVRDSAGVTIVDNPGVPAVQPLHLAEEPLVRIGTVDGDEAYQLYSVRDASRLDDGRIVVVNAGTRDVRVYGPAGRHLATLGGEGDGPGEFAAPSSVVPWAGDTIAVYDSRHRRISLFSAAAGFERAITLPPVDLDGFENGALEFRSADGALVLSTVVFPDPEEAFASGGGMIRPPRRFARVALDGETLADLGEYPGDEAYMNVGDGFINIFRSDSGRRLLVAGAGDHLIVAPAERLELPFVGPDGALRRVVRVAEPPRLVSDADRNAELERRLADVPEERRAGIRLTAERVPLPDTLPPLGAIVHDTEDRTWVMRSRLESDEGPARWIVLDAEGRALGTVELPATLEVFEIGADYVLGRNEDELGIEYVEVWVLTEG